MSNLSWNPWLRDEDLAPPSSRPEAATELGRIFIRTRQLAAYMLDAEPVPLDINVLLVAEGEALNLAVDSRRETALPLAFAIPFPTGVAPSTNAQAARFRALRQVGAVAGGLFAEAELQRAGTMTAAPDRGRQLKDAANAMCWRLSFRAALGAGVDLPLEEREPQVGATTLAFLRSSHAKAPDDRVLLHLHAAAVVVHVAQEHLTRQGMSWPQTGAQLAAIDELLAFCKGFSRLQADVRSGPVRVEVPADRFFAGRFRE